MKQVAYALALATLVAAPATAQDSASPYPVRHSMDFDLWCTEVQRLSWERCDKRLPEDMQRFEAYRDVVERYEVPYLRDKRSVLYFDETILRNDPIDKKPNSSTMQNTPQPND